MFCDKKIAEEEPKTPELEWELVDWNERLKHSIHRSKVPGGWLVRLRYCTYRDNASLTFYPDPSYQWKI
jgi:hypothetical protein